MRTESQGTTTLQDFIRDVGAPYHMHNDNSKMQTSKAWKDILRQYNISASTTEPHHPWQNYAERKIQDIKSLSKIMMDRTGAPENLWFHALSYAAYIKNRVADASLGNKTPTEVAFGETPDISDILQFTFYQPVYYHAPNAPYPSTEEKLGRFWGSPTQWGMTLPSAF